jgi:hypothetical protein
MNRLICVAVLCALAAAPLAASEHALGIAREVERIAGSRVLWPGFEPLSIPLAVYDGKRTYLFRHPAPPEGFAPLAGAVPAAHVYEGRHPAVSANTSADLGGTVSATVMADRVDIDPAGMAAVALHEAFHVFQRGRHPGWQANEGDLLVYPVDDAKLLARRRLESEALRRALADPSAAACWARQFQTFRRERFAAIDPAFAAYERGTELNEGLAQYIQLRAGDKTTVEIPAGEFKAAEVRHRIYTIGPAIAFLLDRLRPGWQAKLEANDRQLLEDLLGEGEKDGQCSFTPAEIERFEQAAREDTAAIRAGRTERRKAFDARPGWLLVVRAAEGQPLWPKGFDPLNVELVDGGLLHTRFLRLGNDAGQVEAIDSEGTDLEALTEGIGPHPLFNGARRVGIAGLPKPEIKTEGGKVEILAPGLTARFANARVEVRGMEATVELLPKPER